MKGLRLSLGISLVEMLIALALGASAITGLAMLVGNAIGLNAKMMQSSRLREELGNSFSLIAHDLQRAGYSGAAIDNLSSSAFQLSEPLTIGQYGSESPNSCITFTYDINANGVLDTQSPNEQFGYRLRDYSIEIRKNGASCTASGWEDLTDSEIVTVSHLSFTPTITQFNTVTETSVAVDLSGEFITSQDAQKVAYSELVSVKNASF